MQYPTGSAAGLFCLRGSVCSRLSGSPPPPHPMPGRWGWGGASRPNSASPDRAAAHLAMLTMVMSAAPAIAPVLGGYATAWIGWRAAFALLALIGGVTLAAAVLLLPETNAMASGTR